MRKKSFRPFCHHRYINSNKLKSKELEDDNLVKVKFELKSFAEWKSPVLPLGTTALLGFWVEWIFTAVVFRTFFCWKENRQILFTGVACSKYRHVCFWEAVSKNVGLSSLLACLAMHAQRSLKRKQTVCEPATSPLFLDACWGHLQTSKPFSTFNFPL